MKRIALSIIVAGRLAAAPLVAPAVNIADNGTAQAVIVVALDDSLPARHAAGELSAFLAEVTGGAFEIVHAVPADGAGLFVGPNAAKWADPAFSTAGLGNEGIVIRTIGDDLVLAGGDPRGTLYAVYTFLEDHVGCRWWTPDAATIPHRPTLQVGPLDVTYIPPLESRETDAFGSQNGVWSARNKYNGTFHQLGAAQGGKYSYTPGFCHTFYTLINPGLYFDDHPEWFSLINGERTTTVPHYPAASLCLSNEEMRHELVERLKQALRDAPPEADSTGLSEVRFYLAGGETFVGDPGPGYGWDTSGSISVTASSEHHSRKGVQAIDGSGLDPATGRLHGTDPDGTLFMTGTRQASAAAPWHAGAVTGEHWVAFQLDRVYELGEMWIWNDNENLFHVQGMRHVTVRCSPTGGSDTSEWVTVFSGEIPEAQGLPAQPHQLAIDFESRPASVVVITAHNNWSGGGYQFVAEVSQLDDAGPPERCECDPCRAIEAEEGSPAGLLMRFVNAVSEDLRGEFPDVPVSTLAYHYTQPPPDITAPVDDVIVRLCSIRCSFGRPMTDPRNAFFSDDLTGWSEICDRLYIWDYVANFSYNLNPHPNLRVLAPNIRFFVDHGVKGVFAEALPHDPTTEMAPLRSWMLAQLMWDPSRDGQALIEEFAHGYYGPAGTAVVAYVDVMHDAVETTDDWLGLSSPPDAEFLSLDTLCLAWRHMEDAARAVAHDPALLQRVEIAQLPVMSVFLARRDELRAQAAAAGVYWPMPDSAASLQERMQEIVARNALGMQAVVTDTVALLVSSSAGAQYELERATDLRIPDWTPTGAYVVGSGASISIHDPDPGTGTAFYRVAATGLQETVGNQSFATQAAGLLIDDGQPQRVNAYRFRSTAGTTYELERAHGFGVGPVGGADYRNGWDQTGAIVYVQADDEKTTGAWTGTAVQTVNGAGISADGTTHDHNPFNSIFWWAENNPGGTPRGGTVAGAHWVEYRFDQPLSLASISIWNYNEINAAAYGICQATIQASLTGSTDPADWTTVFEGTIPQATALPAEPVSLEVALNGTQAQFVVITAHENYGDPLNVGGHLGIDGRTVVGLSEVRFLQEGVPVPIEQADWQGTGAFVVGNGAEMVLFDPAGHSTSDFYRVTER